MTQLGWMLLAPIFIVNVLAAYQAFGRTIEDADRLARQDRLTGLADAQTLRAALDHAWRRRAPGAPPAVLAELALDQWRTLQQDFGPATADAVVAEIAWRLRLGLRPGDILAHCGDGVFRLLLPGLDEAAARGLLQDLLGRVAADGGLHPDADQRLTLSGGLVAIGADGAAPEAVLRQVGARVQCARLAGGDRLVADAVRWGAAPGGVGVVEP